jgi:hypothetical protein
LLVFSPNLLWNVQHDWLTLRFQFGHGFSTDSGPIRLAADALPAATGAQAYTREPPTPMDVGEQLSSLGGFIGEQLLFWGLVLVPIGLAVWRVGWFSGWRFGGGIKPKHDCMTSTLDPAAVSLLGAAALVPLGLFALVALGSEVEANWAAPYLIGAVPFIARLLRRGFDSGVDGGVTAWALAAAAGNLILISLYVSYAVTAFPPLPDAAGRVLRESHGFAELADYTARLPEPVIADRYQFAAMLNFYQPQLAVSQWPGITRPSEYGRGRIAPLPNPQALRQTGFWLLTGKFSPPEITGFDAVETRSLYRCPDGRFTVIDGAATWDAGGCDEPINGWRLYRYRVNGPSGGHQTKCHSTRAAAC